MRKNKIRQIWKDSGTVINGWLAIPNSFSAELMANQNWDSVTIDLQHGIHDYSTAISMLQAISTTDTVPLARVPWNEPGIIMKMLDAGVYGIICPMINTKKECEDGLKVMQDRYDERPINRASAKTKLIDLGFSEDEIKDVWGL